MTVSRDSRDNVTGALADGEGAAVARVAGIEGERDIFRTMVQILLEQAHGDGALIKRQQETIWVNRDEYRRYRERIRLSNGRRHDEDR